MAKYIKHPRQKGKYMCPICDYGHAVGKSRQAVTNHYNKVHAGVKAEETVDISSSSFPSSEFSAQESKESTPPLPQEDDIDDSTPNWLEFDVQESEAEIEHESLPPIANTVLKSWYSSGGMPKTQENLKQFYAQQAKMMRWFFNGIIDPLVSWYGKSVTSKPSFEIKRTPQEWELFEGISQQWLEYRQIVLPVTPDIMMAGCIGSFYVPQMWKIQKQKDRSKSFSPLAIWRRWRKRKNLKAEAKRNPLNVNKDESPYA